MKFDPCIVLYGRTEDSRFGALAEGCEAQGVRPHFQRPGLFRASDAIPSALGVVVNGLGREGRGIAEVYRALGVPVWVLELPRLRGEIDAHALLFDDLQWLPDANGRAVVAEKKVKRTPETALVILQKPDDASHGMAIPVLNQWARNTVEMVREVTGLPVVIRPHPLTHAETPADWWGADALSIPATSALRDDFAKAAVVVTYNSTVGWDAIAAGVPVVALGHAAYADYACLLDRIETLTAKCRADALARAASTQWTLAEMRNGQALAATVLSSIRLSHEAVL
jgi:hypothetical protein